MHENDEVWTSLTSYEKKKKLHAILRPGRARHRALRRLRRRPRVPIDSVSNLVLHARGRGDRDGDRRLRGSDPVEP